MRIWPRKLHLGRIIFISTSIARTMMTVMPMSLRLASHVRGEKADKILRRADQSLLGIMIGETVRKLVILTKLKKDVCDRLPEQ